MRRNVRKVERHLNDHTNVFFAVPTCRVGVDQHQLLFHFSCLLRCGQRWPIRKPLLPRRRVRGMSTGQQGISRSTKSWKGSERRPTDRVTLPIHKPRRPWCECSGRWCVVKRCPCNRCSVVAQVLACQDTEEYGSPSATYRPARRRTPEPSCALQPSWK